MTQFAFDATTVAPQESLAPIPAGIYTANIVDSDVAQLKSGNGTALQLTFVVLDGPCVNRKVWTQLNIRHTNADAERIAQSQLSAICHAVGVPRISDSVQLHGKPMRIRVTIRKDDTGQYGDKNEIKGYEALPRGPAAQVFAAPHPAPQPPMAAAVPVTAPPPAQSAPWARGARAAA